MHRIPICSTLAVCIALVPSSVCADEQKVGTLQFIPAIIAASSRQPDDLPAAGNPEGSCAVPGEALLEDVSKPDQVIGSGTAASCTSAAVVAAVARGGIITFNCGPAPVTINKKIPLPA